MHAKSPKRFFHSILICLIAATLCSCSRIKLAYRFGDLFLTSKAHHFLKLNPEQDRVLNSQIKEYLRWHRKTMLPAYAAACRRLAQGLRGQEDATANIDQVMPLLDSLYAQTLLPLAKPVAGLLAHLRAAQIDFLEQALKNDLAQKRKQYLADPEDARKKRAAKALSYVEEFSGPLSSAQEAQVKALSEAVNVPLGAWLQDREKRGLELLALLNEKKGEPAIEAALKDWWQRHAEPGSPPHPTRVNPVELKAYFLGVIHVLTPAQRERAAQHLDDYAKDFEDLSEMKVGK